MEIVIAEIVGKLPLDDQFFQESLSGRRWDPGVLDFQSHSLAARSAEDRRALVWGFPARNFAVATLIATAAVGQAQMLSFAAVLFATQIAVLVPRGWR